MDSNSWVADGTPEVEPVTTKTPAIEEADVTLATEQIAPETDESQESVSVVEDEVKYIEAKVGEEAFQLPEGVMVPQVRNGETEYVSIQDVIARGQRGNDYRIKTTELGQMRSTLDQERNDFTVATARLEARSASLQAKEDQLRENMTDPTKAAAFQEHLQQYQDNPTYRENVDRALKSEDVEAELQALQHAETVRQNKAGVDFVLSTIEELAAEYPGVSPARVQTVYAADLRAENTQLSREAIEGVFKAENEYLETSNSPLREQLAEITRQMAVLQEANDADQHNDKTNHAVERAKSPPVSTGRSAPAPTATTQSKFSPNVLQEKMAEWTRVR